MELIVQPTTKRCRRYAVDGDYGLLFLLGFDLISAYPRLNARQRHPLSTSKLGFTSKSRFYGYPMVS
ncbi:hypothetical protein GALMADRAFT_230932 [Galerina marginata CBS 339.88]|uniref:Uncharacterized protein n=1 Tax=Galerina marginata (strain CBS 339.88) TaxID=685588 RepID=A0A067SQU1_GALM3|nr:hypothetical protein GALMADRAFT_230932 [Galerina marginata CBS 339.88]